MLMYKKLNLRLQPREKVPFNEERTYQMKSSNPTSIIFVTGYKSFHEFLQGEHDVVRYYKTIFLLKT